MSSCVVSPEIAEDSLRVWKKEINQARSLTEAGRYEKAETSYLQALGLVSNGPESRIFKAINLYELGKLKVLQGDKKQAYVNFQEAKRIFQEQKQQEKEVWRLFSGKQFLLLAQMSELEEENGRTDLALANLKEALQLDGSEKEKEKCRLRLSGLESAQRNSYPLEIRKAVERLASGAEKKGPLNLEPVLQKASLLNEQGKTLEAGKYLRAFIDYAKELKDGGVEEAARQALFQLELSSGNLEEAENICQRALTEKKSKPGQTEAAFLLGKAMIAAKRKDMLMYQSCLKQALAAVDTDKGKIYLGSLLEQGGQKEFKLKHYDLSETYIRSAFQIAKQVPELKEQLPRIAVEIGLVLLAKSERGKAREYFERAAASTSQKEIKFQASMGLLHVAMLNNNKERSLKLAKILKEQSYNLATKCQAQVLLAKSLLAKSERQAAAIELQDLERDLPVLKDEASSEEFKMIEDEYKMQKSLLAEQK